jgi:hypothetical protein
LKRLEAFVSDLPPGRSLDIACGTGYLTRLLHGDVVALDQRLLLSREIARVPVVGQRDEEVGVGM